MKELLIIGPSFFGYVEALKSEIERSFDFKVHILDERLSSRKLIKTLVRLNLQTLNEILSLILIHRIKKVLKNKNIEKILFINPELIREKHLENLKRDYNIEINAYFWDSANNKPCIDRLRCKFDKIATFDFNDAAKFKCPRLDLFSEGIFLQRNPGLKREKSVVFIGTAHSNRLQRLKAVHEQLEVLGYNLDAYLYCPTRLQGLYWYIKSSHFRYYSASISFSPLCKKTIAEKYWRSGYVLDLHHSGQSGLTSRTFEAITAGCVVLTENDYISRVPELRSWKLVEVFVQNEVEIINNSPSNDEEQEYCSINRFTLELREKGLF